MLAPLLTETPPHLGSHRAGDLLAQARLGWTARRWDERAVADITRLFTMSIADLVEERFESDAMRGVLSVSGVIGTWAGPRSAGTAYVMAHHKIGDVGDGKLGAWGFPEGGMGAVTRALADAARAFGATVRTGTGVERILVRDGRAHGVVTESGEEIAADVVIAATHPQITFLRQLDPADLPDEFVADLRRWKTRSGTVKVNLALDRLPEFTRRARLRSRRARRHDRARTEPRPRGAGVPGRGRGPPGRARRSPTCASRRCSTGRSRPRAST